MNSRLVTASDNNKLVVYNLEDGQSGFGGKITLHMELTSHREAIRCVVMVSDA